MSGLTELAVGALLLWLASQASEGVSSGALVLMGLGMIVVAVTSFVSDILDLFDQSKRQRLTADEKYFSRVVQIVVLLVILGMVIECCAVSRN